MENLWRWALFDAFTLHFMRRSARRNGGPGYSRTSPIHATPPRDEPAEMRPPTPGQVAQLLEFVARDPALHLYLTLAATTGARRGQLLALRWIDMDLGRGKSQHSALPGRGSGRSAPRTHQDTSFISSCPRRSESRATAKSSPGHINWWGSDGPRESLRLQFRQAGSRPWSPNFVTKRFIRVRRAAGLDHFRLHDLRHFMATQMLDAGVPIPIVAARLCHARASTTLNVYAHAVPGGDRLAAEALWQRVNEARSVDLAERNDTVHT